MSAPGQDSGKLLPLKAILLTLTDDWQIQNLRLKNHSLALKAMGLALWEHPQSWKLCHRNLAAAEMHSGSSQPLAFKSGPLAVTTEEREHCRVDFHVEGSLGWRRERLFLAWRVRERGKRERRTVAS